MAAAEGAGGGQGGAPARLAHPLGFFGAPAGEYARGARASRALPGRLLAVHAAWGLDLLVATYADAGPTPLLSLHLITFRWGSEPPPLPPSPPTLSPPHSPSHLPLLPG